MIHRISEYLKTHNLRDIVARVFASPRQVCHEERHFIPRCRRSDDREEILREWLACKIDGKHIRTR